MGFGDKLILAGWARKTGKIVDFGVWSELWRHNPHIARPGEPADIRIKVVDWQRRYGCCTHKSEGRHYYNPRFRPARADLFLDEWEVAWAKERVSGGFVLVEPNYKGAVGASNRDWGWRNWQRLVDTRAYRFVQMGQESVRTLAGVERVVTPSFRLACAVLSLSRGIVTTNGGLHHAAAALRVPAVVIWGGYNDPRILGYEDHANLYEPDPACEGRRASCPECRACMNRITVERVLGALSGNLGARHAPRAVPA